MSIPKPGGGERLLGIPTVVDRLIQQAIAQVMGPIFDAGFSESSFGFRPRRGAHGALRQVQASIKAGYRIAVDLDLAKFFDNVQHDILMARVARKVGDTRRLGLIGRYWRAGVMVGENFEPSAIGTPPGGPRSPLLANIAVGRSGSGIGTTRAPLRAVCRRCSGTGQESAGRRAGEGEPHGVSHPEAQASGQ